MFENLGVLIINTNSILFMNCFNDDLQFSQLFALSQFDHFYWTAYAIYIYMYVEVQWPHG